MDNNLIKYQQDKNALRSVSKFIKTNSPKPFEPNSQAEKKVALIEKAQFATQEDVESLKKLLEKKIPKSVNYIFPAKTSSANIVNNGSYLYFGDSGTDGSWRIYVNGTALAFERRESGSWVEKSAFTA